MGIFSKIASALSLGSTGAGPNRISAAPSRTNNNALSLIHI